MESYQLLLLLNKTKSGTSWCLTGMTQIPVRVQEQTETFYLQVARECLFPQNNARFNLNKMQKTVELNLLADCPLSVLQRQLDEMNQLQGLLLCHNQQAQLQVNNKEKNPVLTSL